MSPGYCPIDSQIILQSSTYSFPKHLWNTSKQCAGVVGTDTWVLESPDRGEQVAERGAGPEEGRPGGAVGPSPRVTPPGYTGPPCSRDPQGPHSGAGPSLCVYRECSCRTGACFPSRPS